ncbi:acyltransferase [Fluviispira sanaruensis]|uniref:Acyltransferase n=1 Tax=Fluviispira sanaruensis TaxID=2493639 RepID=A0A4P2VX12_FLUSA|nr:acyltransferase [Fluviispira sanaruensis]BBH54165.1 acyltransferase [Fluviispira sanaruensis]
MDKYIEQHKKRLSYMPWLYYSLKPKQLQWAQTWQKEVQKKLSELETVKIGKDCFISPDSHIFAEPGRDIIIGNRVTIAANVVLHGPITIGDGVSLNSGVLIDGGAKGVFIGKNTRIASGVYIYAFNHATSPNRLIKDQPVISKGIHIGEDVWLSSNVGITDGNNIGSYSVVGMGAIVTHDVPEWAIVAGVPAKVIGDRRMSKDVFKANDKSSPNSD